MLQTRRRAADAPTKPQACPTEPHQSRRLQFDSADSGSVILDITNALSDIHVVADVLTSLLEASAASRLTISKRLILHCLALAHSQFFLSLKVSRL